jgi:hypothetical protein
MAATVEVAPVQGMGKLPRSRRMRCKGLIPHESALRSHSFSLVAIW